MSQKTIVLIIILFTLLIAGMFIFAKIRSSEMQQVVQTPPAQTDVDQVLYPDITRIDAKHYFLEGVHTLVGEIIFPTPCDLLETDALVAESYPEQVTINFSVINNSNACENIMTAHRFRVEVSASNLATFKATFLGRAVELNLVPALEGELPEDFELFFKG